MRLKKVVVIGAVFAFAGCGGGAGETSEAESDSAAEETLELEITGTIGIEVGDSNYVLGAVQQIAHDLSGNILVLDRSACCVRVYSPSGEFIRQISREGSGPGEILNPFSIYVAEDGRILVESPYSGGMHAFTQSGEWLGLVTTFYSNPPMNTVGAAGSSYVAMRVVVDANESGELEVDAFIGLYEEDEEPVRKYWEAVFPFDRNDLTAFLKKSYMTHVFTADRDGNVFIAELTSEQYLVQGLRADGELFLEIRQDVDRVEKTQQEMDEEETYVISYLRSLGAEGVAMQFSPEPYRNSISDLEVDGEGRLWVRRGTVSEPVFDVYDYSGEKLFTASVPEAGDDAAFWDFTIDEFGIIAYSANPELFQQVYILEPSDL